MRRLLILVATFVGGLAAAAQAADFEEAPAPTADWTGFYVGGLIGGGWADRTVDYTANDPAAAIVVTGGIVAFPGNQPIFPHGFDLGGITGGAEAGYNWQLHRRWVVGVEADFSASDIKGDGSGTSVVAALPAFTFPQTVSSEQRINWWGTVRGRLGWLATDDLLLFGTGGLAYGKATASDSYIFNGPGPAGFDLSLGGSSFACTVNVICFDGSASDVKIGWTAGGGAEWRLSPAWSVKAEYLYANLGRQKVTATANALGTPGTAPSSYTADFGRTDFHAVRLGVNFHF